MFNINLKYSGRYRLQTKDANGRITKDTGWFDNLIVNQGLDFLGFVAYNGTSRGAVQGYCAVGTGNTAPSTSDTTLVAQIAWVDGGFTSSYSNSYVPGPPAYHSTISSYTFPVGSATGVIAEVGVGPYPDNPLLLFSRALIVDGGGSPTTITVLSTESLIVTYELRCYLDLTDHSYSCTISGVTYSGIWRMSTIGAAPTLGVFWSFTSSGGSISYSISPTFSYFNGSIGPTSGSPTGSVGPTGGNFTIANTPYTTGTYYITKSETVPVGECNFSGGLSAGMSRTTSGSLYTGYSFQWSISPSIPKDADHTLTQSFTFSWSRYP